VIEESWLTKDNKWQLFGALGDWQFLREAFA
jgi:hypothetical protein